MLTALALAVVFSASSVTLTMDPPLYLEGIPIHEFQFEHRKFDDSGMYAIAGTIGNSQIRGTCSISGARIRCDLDYRGKYDGDDIGDTFVPGLMIIDADLNFTGTALLCFVRTGECPVTLQVRVK